MALRNSPRSLFRLNLMVVAILGLLFLNGVWSHHKAGILKSSLLSVYKDRLMAESYLLDLSDLLHQRNLIMQSCGAEQPPNAVHNELRASDTDMDRIIAHYQATELTADEQVCFDRFKVHISELHDLEAGFMTSNDQDAWLTVNADELAGVFAATADDMDRLSRIQVDEGRNLTERSSSLIASTAMLSELQMALVFVVGLLLFSVLAESRVHPTNTARNASLN